MEVLEKERSESLHEAAVIDLLEQLLKQAQDQSSKTLQKRNGHKQEVVLKVQTDNSQYTLTCTPLTPKLSQVHLSPREKEVVSLVAKGLPNKTIAVVLDISPWTVATHLRRVFGKLHVCTRAEMVARVIEEGSIDIRR